MKGCLRVWGIGLWLVLTACSPAFGQARQDTSSLTFAVVGHVRGAVDGSRNYLFAELLEDLRALRPDLVILTGDMIWGSYDTAQVSAAVIEKDWQALDSALATLGVPVYRVPGNHDINDPITRDIYFARYGRPPQHIDIGDVRFLLLNSSFVPPGDSLPKKRRPHIGGVPLDTPQIGFLRESLNPAGAYRHAFAFVHHVLWWKPDAAWWTTVHPLLRDGRVKAVFAGDYGPMKFSHVRRDGIDYLQSAIEDFPALRILQKREESRLLYQQFDNYLLVTVRGDSVDVAVKVLGAINGGKFTPERFTQITSWEPTRVERLRAALGSPKRAGAAALVLLASFVAGAVTASAWRRRQAKIRSAG